MTASAAVLGLSGVSRPAQPRLLRREDTLSGKDVAIPRAVPGESDDDRAKTEVLEVEGLTAPWVTVVVERLNHLASLAFDWDGEGGMPVRPEAGWRALQLLGDLMSPTVFTPSIVPGEAGGLWLEWHTPVRSCEVEVRPEGIGTVYWRDREQDSEWEGSYADTSWRIHAALEGLTT